MNITRINTASHISLLAAPVILDIEDNHDGSCSVTCEAEITTNNVTFRVHAIAICERVDDGFGEINRVSGWLDLRAKEADGTSIEKTGGKLVDLKVSDSARCEILKVILRPSMHPLRVANFVLHLPIKPCGYIYEYRAWEANAPKFVICKQGMLFGVYDQKDKTVVACGFATKEEAHALLLSVIADEKEALAG
jgi:hypothetical protein